MSTRSKTLLLSLLLCFTALGMGYLFLQHTPSWGFAQALFRHHELLDIWRYVLYTTIVFFWPYLIKTVGNYYHWTVEFIAHLSNQRLKLCVFFISIESIIIHNALGHFIA